MTPQIKMFYQKWNKVR